MQKLFDRTTRLGLGPTLMAQIARRVDGATASLRHSGEQPSLSAICACATVVTSAGDALEFLLPALDQLDPAWEAQWSSTAAELADRYDAAPLKAPAQWRVEAETSKLLFAIIMATEPVTVLETGVANGHSTVFNLRALQLAGCGQLHSVDIAADVGSLLTHEERSVWRLHVFKPATAARDFSRLVSKLGAIDVFFHDSDHSYTGQMCELLSAWEALSPGGIAVIDDVNESWAYFDFVAKFGLDALCLFDQRKLVGIVQKPLK